MTTRTPSQPNAKVGFGDKSWVGFFKDVVARLPRSGQATFAGASVAVQLDPKMPDDQYDVFLSPVENRVLWITSRTADGFTINASAASTDTIGYIIVRR